MNRTIGEFGSRHLFLKRVGLKEDQLESAQVEWSMLERVYDRHLSMRDELMTTARYVFDRLQSVPEVHSLKLRIKDVEHLLAKILRKKCDDPKRELTDECYEDSITDLIGVRALHLFKDDWKPIDAFIRGAWEFNENPIAYVREGDNESLIARFKDAGFEIKQHKYGYRSIHYVIKSQPAKRVRFVELQVRTMFEEGWSEIDHRVRYPTHSDNAHLTFYLTIFNRLAGSADEMGTFTNHLYSFIKEQANLAEEQAQQIDVLNEELNNAVSQLKLSTQEKEQLQAKVKALQSKTQEVKASAAGGLASLALDPNFIISASQAYGSGKSLSFTGISAQSDPRSGYVSISSFGACVKCGKGLSPLAGDLTRMICKDCG